MLFKKSLIAFFLLIVIFAGTSACEGTKKSKCQECPNWSLQQNQYQQGNDLNAPIHEPDC